MSGSTGWRCRPVRAGDEEAIVALFECAFERPTSIEQWRWKLGAHGDDLPNAWVAVAADDRPVSHYGGVPRCLQIAGREHSVMVVADAMTAPDAQRRGAFTAVVRSAHAAWREAGIGLVLGMPNERFGSRIGALGWRRVCALCWAIRPLRPALLLRRRFPIARRLPGGYLADRAWNAWHDRGASRGAITLEAAHRTADEAAYRTAVETADRTAVETADGATDGTAVEPADGATQGTADGTADEVACRAAFAELEGRLPRDRLALRRDPDWLTHRLLRGPEAPHDVLVAREAGRTVGYCAFRTRDIEGRRIGAVTELAAASDGVGDLLIRDAAMKLRRDGAEMAITLVVPGSPEHEVVRRRGFRFSWGTFDVHAVLLDQGLDVEYLRNADWMLSGADFDVL